MKIDVKRIPAEGLTLEEEFAPGKLDLSTDIIQFRDPIKIKAQVARITNALTVILSLDTNMYATCGRCLEEYEMRVKRDIRLHYPVNESVQSVDLDPDIREELVLDFPMKPLCRTDCKGLCPKCGENINEGKCKCQPG